MYTYYHLILPGSLPLRDIYFVLIVEILVPQILSHPIFLPFLANHPVYGLEITCKCKEACSSMKFIRHKETPQLWNDNFKNSLLAQRT